MKVLVAEDDRVTRRMLEAIVTECGYEVVAASDGAIACQVLQGEDPPQLAIMDWVMPGMDGRQVCAEVRKTPREAYTYILLLTAKGQKDDIIMGLEAGADDYLIKPFDPHELRARLNTGRRILDLQNQLIAAREAMRAQANHDPLTGVWNRRVILETLTRELIRGQREGRPVGVILADLDHFKRINDTHGHLAGDAVLCEAARRMSAVMRPYDQIGRYGGEEFLIVLPGCDEPNTLKIGERLRHQVAAQPVDHQGRTIPVTISLGVVVSSGAHHGDAPAFVHAADVALYRAKAGGRNRVEVNTVSATT
jgi:diguanylate cyclase (GGDEF)-like protein